MGTLLRRYPSGVETVIPTKICRSAVLKRQPLGAIIFSWLGVSGGRTRASRTHGLAEIRVSSVDRWLRPASASAVALSGKAKTNEVSRHRLSFDGGSQASSWIWFQHAAKWHILPR